MAAETYNKPLFRKPSPTMWTKTALILLYAACCVLVFSFTLSGHLLNRQSFDCGLGDEFASKLTGEATLVWVWLLCNLVFCMWILLCSWIKESCYILMGIAVVPLAIIMIIYYDRLQTYEIQEMQKFKERYFGALPFKKTQNQLPDAHKNVHCWQTEFKCCGLETYQEWESSIPDSCLCDGEDGSSGCVRVGNSFVYEKPCLPTVVSFVEKQSSTFQIVIIIWLSIPCIPFAIFLAVLLLYLLALPFGIVYLIYESCNLSTWKYELGLKEKMVPVVFIRKDSNNQMEEDDVEDGKAKECIADYGVTVNIENGTNVEGEGGEEYVDDNPVKMIPLSQFKRLQEELDPPPVQHKVLEEPSLSLLHTESSKPRNFYTVVLEEGSPLLPSDTVLTDPNKPTRNCYWREGNRFFNVDYIIWPTQKKDPACS